MRVSEHLSIALYPTYLHMADGGWHISYVNDSKVTRRTRLGLHFCASCRDLTLSYSISAMRNPHLAGELPTKDGLRVRKGAKGSTLLDSRRLCAAVASRTEGTKEDWDFVLGHGAANSI